MKKKFLLSILAACIFGAVSFTAASAQDITIKVNDNIVQTDTAPVMVNDRVLVPLRAVSNALNCGVGYDASTQGIIILQGSVGGAKEHLAMCWINKDHAFVLDGLALGNTYVMDVPPVIENERTLVPIRAISELLGATVDWDGANQTVEITASLPEKKIDDSAAEKLSSYEALLFKSYDGYAAYADGNPQIVNIEIGLENGGVITAQLYPELAPTSVWNFVKLADAGIFDGTIFHRVIENFMIQGGAFETNGNHREADPIHGEFILNGVLNIIPHERGVLSMARTEEPNSASNQFFIMHQRAEHLDGSYAAFGRVTSGMEYVDRIAATATNEDDKPIENQVISYIKVVE